MEEDFKTTVSHVVIRSWGERHQASPALIVDPNQFDREIGLRLDFPGHRDEALLSRSHQSKDTSWEEFFRVFEQQQLAFDYLEEPGETPLVDAYRFVKREALADEAEKPTIDPEELARAVRDDLPEYATHSGLADDPHSGEVEVDVSEDTKSDEELSGTTADLESDDDTTQAAREAGILDPDDKKRLHDSGEL